MYLERQGAPFHDFAEAMYYPALSIVQAVL